MAKPFDTSINEHESSIRSNAGIRTLLELLTNTPRNCNSKVQDVIETHHTIIEVATKN
jgi:hypothetical protein